ncbi:MAG TPA: VWA domain-containing protein [Pyrinomonadaceae bacterium]|nr:VWA domain-containing protein [Pyrinomonadaceae bacterium]
MFPDSLTIKRLSFALLICLALSLPATQAQQGSRPATPQGEEVVRINTELVQTDVMVFDKDGHFVEGLKPDQFELRIDGKPVPISFFERVTAGSVNEDAQLAAARGQSRTTNAKDQPAPKPLDRGRTILFFIDDLHLDAGNLPQTRKMLMRFIDREVGQNDQMAITSPSGQIGFLQQLTDNKAVLRAAVERLKPRPRRVIDMDRPPMREYQALSILRYDRDVTDYFVEKLREDNPMLSVESATEMVMSRARGILQQAAVTTTNTLASLASLIRTASQWPGRKVLFFISDGFFIDDQTKSNSFDLRHITDNAARAGVVIYSIDSRGLVASLIDASTQVATDYSGRLARYNGSELLASQDALNALAVDTGGRAQFNTNALDQIIPKALEETSVYYLLAWRPEGEEQRGGKFRRIEVKVKGRPDLMVRVRRGFFDADAKENVKRGSSAAEAQRATVVKTSDDELRSAIKSLYTQSALPTHVALTYMDAPNAGPMLTVSTLVDTEFIGFDKGENSEKGAVDILGVVLNDQGKSVASFSGRLNITAKSPSTPESKRPDVLYNYPVKLPPGLYQARVAARDAKSGRTGSATEWIEIPDLASHKLYLSSLIVSEVFKEAASSTTDPAVIVKSRLSVDRHFNRASKLRFLTFIYNASRGASGNEAPDAAVQIQVLRDDQPVLTTPLRKIEYDNSTDLARLPYAAEIPLETMLPGRYVLQVSVIDRISKTSVTQHINFEIE